MRTETTHTRPDITFAEMKTFLTVGWGKFGERIADKWLKLNRTYFRGRLQPLPITLVNTSPYGHWLGITACNPAEQRAHLIQLTAPRQEKFLVADVGVLLHEMVHQYLAELGEETGHDSEPWCREIMRLHYKITREKLWASPSVVRKEKIGGKLKSVRKQKPCPDTGETSLPRADIATWPHSVGVDLGAL